MKWKQKPGPRKRPGAAKVTNPDAQCTAELSDPGPAPVFGEPPRREVLPVVTATACGAHALAVDFGLLGDHVEMRAACLTGTSHLREGSVRQDEYCVSQVGDFIVVSVADGLGTADSSHHGAALAAHSTCQSVQSVLAAEGVQALDFDAIATELDQELTALARELAVDRNRVSTTVVVAVVQRSGSDEVWPLVAARVGDSTVRLLRDDSWSRFFDDEEDQAQLVNHVEPLPGTVTVTQGEWRPGDVVVLLSDGVDIHLGSGAGAVGRELARAWKAPPEPLQFVSQLSFRRRAASDDRTAVALWRRCAESEVSDEVHSRC